MDELNNNKHASDKTNEKYGTITDTGYELR